MEQRPPGPTQPVDMAAWTRRLADIFVGRKVIMAFFVLAGMTHRVDQLLRYGARRPLLIPHALGTGAVPSAADADVHLLAMPPERLVTDEVRRTEQLSIEPTEDIRRAVEAYDRDRRAVWWLAPPCRTGELLGRPAYGGRPASWAALEDKLIADDIWAACKVPGPPVRVASCTYDELVGAARELDRGSGTVWSGDARDGLNGGAEYTFWVRTERQARSSYSFLTEHCERVRVMPFLEGTPCSIHGFVLPDGVAVFRPVETVVLRRPDTGRFVYGGLGTWWDPPDGDRAHMRIVARRVGGWLADAVGYRGGFSVDGVLTADGFVPTEMNPRFTGGLTTVARATPDVPLELLQLNVVAGNDPAISAADFESLVVTAADENRGGRMMGISVGGEMSTQRSVEVIWEADRFREAQDGEEPTGTATLGPGPVGGIVLLETAPDALRSGMRMAEMNAALLRFADAEWGTDFGRVEPAADVRR
ncbi:MAG: hypothetical protein GEU93_22305 [Propionibacteriales bacterium]|nr:hypothetical protein [Propionibacteriales bacterium]